MRLETEVRRDGRERSAAARQRAGVHLAAHAGLVPRLEGGSSAHPDWPSDAELARRVLPRQAARRVPQRKLVRTLNDVRCTLSTWREEYNCERPHRFDGDGSEIISKQNQNWETTVMSD